MCRAQEAKKAAEASGASEGAGLELLLPSLFSEQHNPLAACGARLTARFQIPISACFIHVCAWTCCCAGTLTDHQRSGKDGA